MTSATEHTVPTSFKLDQIREFLSAQVRGDIKPGGDDIGPIIAPRIEDELIATISRAKGEFRQELEET